MATIMNKSEMLKLISSKEEELHLVIKALLKGVSFTTGEKISECTVHTQMHVQKSKLKDLILIKHLLEDQLDEADMNHFVSMTTLAEERNANRTIVHAGDNVMSLVLANPNLTVAKIQKACEKAGLTIGSDGIIR